jgi:hypothetical protein
MEIKLGKRGMITSGYNEGWYVLIQDDRAGTGGFYVFTSTSPEFNGGLGEGYDDWVEKEEYLQPLFEHSGWEVVWDD